MTRIFNSPNQIAGNTADDSETLRITGDVSNDHQILGDPPTDVLNRVRSTYTGSVPTDVFIKLAMYAAEQEAMGEPADLLDLSYKVVDTSQDI